MVAPTEEVWVARQIKMSIKSAFIDFLLFQSIFNRYYYILFIIHQVFNSEVVPTSKDGM